MSAAPAQAPARPVRAGHPRPALPGRLLRLELRRNVMLWVLPVAVALFWLIPYRKIMALPPLWNVRAMTMQSNALLVFVLPTVGAAAWMGSREGRHGMTDLVAGTARPRWARQLATWAATTGWALVAYVGCVAVLYAVTARQSAWGGPLWLLLHGEVEYYSATSMYAASQAGVAVGSSSDDTRWRAMIASAKGSYAALSEPRKLPTSALSRSDCDDRPSAASSILTMRNPANPSLKGTSPFVMHFAK